MQIFLHDIPTNQYSIQTVTTNPAREDRAITTTLQFRLHDRYPYQVYMILLLLEGGIASLILRACRYTLTKIH